MFRLLPFLLILLVMYSCKPTPKLPVYGMEYIQTDAGYDTIINKVAPFEFLDQKGEVINNTMMEGNIFIADFFFTSCPSICPVMTKHMLSIHDAYAGESDIKFISHTIDPVRDSVQKLEEYAQKIGITNNDRWHFVTGEKEDLYNMAEHYMIIAFEDDEVPGGFEHSGYFILIDKEQQTRGYYDGTSKSDVDQLIVDLAILMDEY